MDELIDLGFNPYFTGSNSGSLAANSYRRIFLSFNPYFTGSNSGSKVAVFVLRIFR